MNAVTAKTQAKPEVITLWPEGAPGSEDWTWHEEESVLATETQKVVRNVSQPTLTMYPADPAIANGTAVIVCPGGAFHFLVTDREGVDIARWLNACGVTVFVLKYRLIRTGDDFFAEVDEHLSDRNKMAELMKPLRPLIVADGQQAVRLVRKHAAEWSLAPDHIGIMGFSAGGAVTANVALLHDDESRPDFAAPIYSAGYEDAPVPADAPPLFLLCADDDLMASKNSLRLYADWKAAGRPVELHIYAQGGHGFSSRQQHLPCDTWLDRFGDWLASQGLLK